MFIQHEEDIQFTIIKGYYECLHNCSSHLSPYVSPSVGHKSCKGLSKQEYEPANPLLGPALGVASTIHTSVTVNWEQGQVLIMAPPSLSSLVFDTEEDRLRVMDLRN